MTISDEMATAREPGRLASGRDDLSGDAPDGLGTDGHGGAGGE